MAAPDQNEPDLERAEDWLEAFNAEEIVEGQDPRREAVESPADDADAQAPG